MTALPRVVCLCCVLLAMSGCTTAIYHQQQLASGDTDTEPAATKSSVAPITPRKIAIFFDGTANNVEADTNIKRLHSLVSLQNRPDIATLYVEGVGVGNDVIGAGTGSGFESRVVLGYNFLRSHYRKDDQIYLFGFSRGAYQARALASMLYYIGLPDAPPAPGNSPLFGEQIKHAKTLFADMKEGFYSRRYPCEIAQVRDPAKGPHQYKSRRIEALGLWDTVSALGGGILGWPERLAHKADIAPFAVDIDEPNIRYGDQLHNVNHVFQAVSLDDNREWIFTPLLVTRQHLLSNKRLPNRDERAAKLTDNCQVGPPRVEFSAIEVEGTAAEGAPNIAEVWFPGAHSDVGGGYVGTDLPGLSLNWMIAMLEGKAQAKLLPAGAGVRSDAYGSSHDPEAGWWSPIYHRMNRNLAAYALGNAATCGLAGDARQCGAPGLHEPMAAFAGKLCMHSSVFERRKAMPPRDHENRYLDLMKPGVVSVCATDRLSNPRILRQHSANENCTAKVLPVTIQEFDPKSLECMNPQEGGTR